MFECFAEKVNFRLPNHIFLHECCFQIFASVLSMCEFLPMSLLVGTSDSCLACLVQSLDVRSRKLWLRHMFEYESGLGM